MVQRVVRGQRILTNVLSYQGSYGEGTGIDEILYFMLRWPTLISMMTKRVHAVSAPHIRIVISR